MLSSIRGPLASLVCRQQYHQMVRCLPMWRAFSSSSSSETVPKQPLDFVAIKLSSTRRLLRVSGVDSFIYLQSLLTNDMRQLLPLDRLEPEWIRSPESMSQLGALDQPVIYSYLLSAVGKVLADLYVYRGRYRAEDGEYIVEIDAKLATALKRLLLGYNLSRNVKVELARDLDLWTLIPLSNFTETILQPSDPQHELQEIDSDDLKLIPDPRLGAHILGYRFLTRLGGARLEDIGKYIKSSTGGRKIRLREGSLSDYVKLRYRLGIAEGYEDILSGFYFPFELNGDLLNAVSLNKGLYTSEEKVIKIYSTTPVKRRIFPVKFLASPATLRAHPPAPRTFISARPYGSDKFGELRARSGRHGIAVLWAPFDNNKLVGKYGRFPTLTHADTGLKLHASIPYWWPRNFDCPQLPIPDYPRCLFNLTGDAAQQEEMPQFYGIPEDHFTTSLAVVQE